MSNQPSPTPLTRVVALVDGSAPSSRAVAAAAQVAQGLGLPLELLKVAEPLLSESAADVAAFEEALKVAGPAALERLRAKHAVLEAAAAKLPPGLSPTLTLLEGKVKETLLQALDQREGALVFAGRTGKNAITRVLKGSVATALATYSTRPVVIVP